MSDVLKQACPDFRGGYCGAEIAHPGTNPRRRTDMIMQFHNIRQPGLLPMCGASSTDQMRTCHEDVLLQEAQQKSKRP